jgi:hypothetical protein
VYFIPGGKQYNPLLKSSSFPILKNTAENKVGALLGVLMFPHGG